MTSLVKSVFAKAAPFSNDSSHAHDVEAPVCPARPHNSSHPEQKYRLHVTAGPTYEASTHATVAVNTAQSVLIESAHLTARVTVRVRDFSGLPSSCPRTSDYFSGDGGQHARDRYSIAFSFIPKRDLPAADAVWGPDCAHPVRDRLPPGFNVAVGIVKRVVDRSIELDAYADEPWVYAPALSCWFVLRIGERVDGGGSSAADVPHPCGTGPDDHPSACLEEGADGSGAAVRAAWGCPAYAAQRREWFVRRQNRERIVFEKGRLYQADFFNPYLDFGKFRLRLPGFSLGVLKYIDEKTHQLRWVFKDRVTGEVYFCVIFNLLFGDELAEALRVERATGQRLN